MSNEYSTHRYEPAADRVVDGEVLSSQLIESADIGAEPIIDITEGLPPPAFTGLAFQLTEIPLHRYGSSFIFADAEGQRYMISRDTERGTARTRLFPIGANRQRGSIVVDAEHDGRNEDVTRAEIHMSDVTFYLRKKSGQEGIWTYAEGSHPNTQDRLELVEMLLAYAKPTVEACQKLRSYLSAITTLSSDLFRRGPGASLFHLLPDDVDKTHRRRGVTCTIDSTLRDVEREPMVQIETENGDEVSVTAHGTGDELFYRVAMRTTGRGQRSERLRFDLFVHETHEGAKARAIKPDSRGLEYSEPQPKTLERVIALLQSGAEIYPIPLAERLRRFGQWVVRKSTRQPKA